ncbi:MAG: orotidine 5'-phosphate decarboxylase / HUMPS family protein [Candidatus Wukongarchaeota archaeon]|nr:orotidine 5'-phosphate decarboxylase / HUMPS family protein [Candidatus Wukongarchaeota archaeon]MDO8128101.1 orotidine 5'-phosphate decarboxylase / HUMPS family protein [Candidatus Wukongarchaeota archaeon]
MQDSSLFLDMLEEVANQNNSRIILALDDVVCFPSDREGLKRVREEAVSRAFKLIELLSDLIAGVKINRQLVLPLGLYDYVFEIVDFAHGYGLPCIADCKVGDVGHTNRWIATHYFNAGFDAIIANPFVGWRGGLDSVFDEARKREKGVILLVYMSHAGALEGFEKVVLDEEGSGQPFYLVFARKAVEWKASGIVVGATFPGKIIEVKEIVKEESIPIFSPGVGAQGGSAREAVEAGADYLIVGRTIISSSDPRETVKKLLKDCSL